MRDDYLLRLELRDQEEMSLFMFEEFITGEEERLERLMDEWRRRDHTQSWDRFTANQ